MIKLTCWIDNLFSFYEFIKIMMKKVFLSFFFSSSYRVSDSHGITCHHLTIGDIVMIWLYLMNWWYDCGDGCCNRQNRLLFDTYKDEKGNEKKSNCEELHRSLRKREITTERSFKIECQMIVN